MSPTVKTEIKPATGKLGILTPGMGAVATTFIAGVEAIRRGLPPPGGFGRGDLRCATGATP